MKSKIPITDINTLKPTHWESIINVVRLIFIFSHTRCREEYVMGSKIDY